jgi:hypothetical protein
VGEPLIVKNVVDFFSVSPSECKKLNLAAYPLNLETAVNREEIIAISLGTGALCLVGGGKLMQAYRSQQINLKDEEEKKKKEQEELDVQTKANQFQEQQKSKEAERLKTDEDKKRLSEEEKKKKEQEELDVQAKAMAQRWKQAEDKATDETMQYFQNDYLRMKVDASTDNGRVLISFANIIHSIDRRQQEGKEMTDKEKQVIALFEKEKMHNRAFWSSFYSAGGRYKRE